MNEVKKVPRLRFPGFEGEWEKYNLGELAEVKRGAASQHLTYVDSSTDGIRLLRINDFLNDDPVYVLHTKDIERFKVCTNDLLIAGTGATAGIVFIVPEKYNGLAYSYNAPRIRVHGANFAFVFSYLNTPQIFRQQKSLFVGNAQAFLDTEAMRGFKIFLPTLPEQQKIAAFLTVLDTRLQQLQRKKALLEQYKKGLMQQIFSRKIRFRDEEGKEFGAWEEKPFETIATFSKGKGIAKSDISENGNLECIRYGELYTHYGEVISEIQSRTNLDSKDLILSDFNDVIIPSSGETQLDIAKASCVLKKGVALGGDLNIIKTKMDGVFLSFYLNNVKKLEIASLAQGNSVVHLYPSQLKTLMIEFPVLPEQQKIATFLTALDTKIAHVTTQITLTQTFKKGLLQQMFV